VKPNSVFFLCYFLSSQKVTKKDLTKRRTPPAASHKQFFVSKEFVGLRFALIEKKADSPLPRE